MPNTTEQHSWYYPTDGERDYEDTFETFFEQLDDDVEIRDTETNRSNYNPVAGAKFIATDTGEIYLADGNSWNSLDIRNTLINTQRGDPTTSELSAGENMTYNSDGSGTGAAGDLVYAVNDGGTIKTTVVAAVANAT